MPIIIDRRKNPGNKSLNNRQRFIERFKGQIKDAARKQIGDRSISNNSDQEITISGNGTDEPHFNHKQDSGEWDYVLPGNKDYIPGDTIDKPKKGGAGGSGSGGGGEGKGQDDFTFLLSYDEYLDVIFDGLELPDLIKVSKNVIESHQLRRAGFTTAGVPSNLNVEKTSIAGLSRRIALKTPKLAKIHELEEELKADLDEDKKISIQEEIAELRRRASTIGYLDNVDLRYNNFVQQPKPITQAVMFCILDVSYSMGEREKIIAKKFFLLLHLFLQRQYKNIQVVFVRHHETAEECDEETFFTSKEAGGTKVSTAYDVVDKAIQARYDPTAWNIYIAQASDGDNFGYDNVPAKTLLDGILKTSQFMAYIEIARKELDIMHYHLTTSLWDVLNDTKMIHPHIEMQKIYAENDVVSVFRKFFSKDKK